MEAMQGAVSVRFVPAAVAFLLICVSVLLLAAASTLVPASERGWGESRAAVLSTLLR
ncbi:MAG: hypothetical protein ABSD13_02415 [Candidatus Korobacteraceae bacterium]|jgi:hypothetical protein